MTKWIWYCNFAIILLTVILAAFGFTNLQTLENRFFNIKNDTPSSAQENDSDQQKTAAAGGDSPLVAVIKQFSRRWQPPPPPEPGKGVVKINIVPELVISQNPQWKINDGDWKNSGDIVEDIPVGRHIIKFSQVEGWRMPKPLYIQVVKDQTLEKTALYLEPLGLGSITIAIEPNQAIGKNARWRIDGGAWLKSNVTLDNLLEGEHLLEFNNIENWQTPPGRSVIVVKDQHQQLNFSYDEPPPTGAVMIYIEPDEAIDNQAQWKLGNNPWQNSGAILNNITIDTNTVSFKSIPGWNSPDPITIEVIRDQTTQATARYSKQKPPAPKFSLQGTLVIENSRSIAWFSIPNEPKPVTVFQGEKFDAYQLLRVNDGDVVLFRDGYEYALKVPPKKKNEQPPPPQPPAAKPGKTNKRTPPIRRRPRK